MVERIGDLPDEVLGFRITGRLERDEYHDTPMAPIDHGEKLRALVERTDDFHGLDTGPLSEDLEAADQAAAWLAE